MESRRQEWAQRVERWRRSGLTARRFAASIGVKATTLSHWAWRLNRERRDRQRPAVRRRAVAGGVDATRFIELIPGRSEERRFEIELADGRRVRVPADFDAPALRRLLALLSGTLDAAR
jgi:transposase